ncbi:MAG: S41 family peptidase [Chitinophagales bacterium]|nr:S41 family peptidase [Chitinophagales bacterium]
MESENSPKTKITITGKETKTDVFKPFIYSLLVAAGVVIGLGVARVSFDKHKSLTDSKSSKLDDIIDFVKYKYVDTVNTAQMNEIAIEKMLSSLDPHSVYIPASDMNNVNEELDGNFDGIGIEFYIVKDTITVVSAISGGPSEQIGIHAGDKIVKINDTIVAGIKIKNKDVTKKLKGPGGTKVKVTMLRANEKALLDFTIVRGKIPLHSIDASYLIDEKTGYIKINRFSSTTYNEFHKALRTLTDKKIERLVVDLRQNPGGYLQAATEIADELLGGEKLIVYTQGKSVGKNEYNAKRPGLFERGKLAILIDQYSASASEILSGAVQDWDRGTIVGRTSFGKGLVQEQYELADGSALRLTVARYYTPSGRSIQRPYSKDVADYYEEVYDRYDKGQFLHADTTRNDSLKYTTSGGRTVYGGGGIRPDVFVPIDTSADATFVYRIRSVMPEFVYSEFSSNPNLVEGYADFYAYKKGFDVTPEMMAKFKKYVQGIDPKLNETLFNKSQPKIARLMKAYFAKQKWQSDGFYFIENDDDNVINAALKSMQ